MQRRGSRGVKLIRGECHDTRDLPLLDEGEVVYSGLQQNQSIDSEEKITTYVVSRGKAYISTELAGLIYDKWKRTKYFGQRLHNKEQIELDKECEIIPMKHY